MQTPIRNLVEYTFAEGLKPENRDRPALILDDAAGAQVTFGQIYAHVGKIANMIRALDIQPGDRVLMSVSDGTDFLGLFFGSIAAGAVPIPVNTWLTADDYRLYIEDSGARLLVIDQSLAPMIREISPGLETVSHIVTTGGEAGDYPLLDDLIADQPAEMQIHDANPDDVAFWLYSSGSTGKPKGVLHSHGNLYWATELFGLGAQGINRDDVVFCPPKMFFAYGLGNQVYFPLRAGATNIINSGTITAEKCWKLWLKHRPTIVMSVPTLYASMLQYAEDNLDREQVRAACSRLRFCVSGGELLPPGLLERWQDYTGIEVLDAVGTTEMLHMFMMNRPGGAVKASCGRLVGGYEAEIVDDEGQPVPHGTVGNLIMRGPSAAMGYWNNPEKTRETFTGRGVLTGDSFYRDDKGNFFHVGRSDDMLRVGGIWVSPTEVEAALCEHAAVLECAVVGHADEQDMIKPKAYVLLRPGKKASEQQLIETVRDQLSHYKAPHWVEFVDELPKTTTGKIQRFRLRN